MSRTPLHRLVKKLAQQALTKDPEHVSNPDRRALLSQVARFSILAPITFLSGKAAINFIFKPKSHTLPRIAIIGGGLGGLVAAHRLSQAGLRPSLFESSSRWGGRVHTLRNFNTEGMFCELGGELIDSNHVALRQLAQELHLELEDLHQNDAPLRESLFFFGGAPLDEHSILPLFQPLAERLAVDAAQAYGSFDSIHYRQFTPTARFWDELSIDDYLTRRASDIDSRVLQLIKTAYLGEYGLECHEQSALNLLSLIGTQNKDTLELFGESDERYRIRGGNGHVTDALARRLQTRMPLHLESQWRSVHRDPSRGYTLVFEQPGRTVSLEADIVIAAIPLTQLRNIEGISQLELPTSVQKTIEEMGYGTNSKRMIDFRARSWRMKSGLPGVPRFSGALYTTEPLQSLWETSRVQPGNSGILTNFLGGQAGATAHKNDFPFSLQAIDRLLPGLAAQATGLQAFANWSQHPHTRGSYSCPRKGQQTRLVGALSEPSLEESFFFAGEHVSIEHMGFMNGAVTSGENAAHQILRRLKLTGSRA